MCIRKEEYLSILLSQGIIIIDHNVNLHFGIIRKSTVSYNIITRIFLFQNWKYSKEIILFYEILSTR